MSSLYILLGDNSHVNIQPCDVTAMTWPLHKSVSEGFAGTTMDSLLIGRSDGTIVMLDAFCSSDFHTNELTHCTRKNGKITHPDQ